MAKKATKKTKKKTAKKTTRTNRRRTLCPSNPAVQWAEKIRRISLAAGDPPQTGQHCDGTDFYPFTRAEEVYRHYRDHMWDEGIIMVPGEVRTFRDNRAYRVEAEFKIIDVDTGYSVSMWGSGLGNNGVWALQSATTVAKKETLLLLFGAAWSADIFTIETTAEEQWQMLWSSSTPKEMSSMLSAYFDEVHRHMQEIRDKLPKCRQSRK